MRSVGQHEGQISWTVTCMHTCYNFFLSFYVHLFRYKIVIVLTACLISWDLLKPEFPIIIILYHVATNSVLTIVWPM